ncbi:MAG: hypothetical protein BV459_02530 [Thermoplasmata archaeon M11B2D]|nr:MAG: hypothetical protein BV459_02530 [Thermoplasmata archaeon M11B2D]
MSKGGQKMTVDWPVLLLVSIILIIFPLILLLSLWRYRSIKQLMEQQALKRNGTVTGSFLLPVLKLSYHTLPVVVTSVPGSKYRQAKTEVICTLYKPATADLKITRETAMSRLGKTFISPDVTLGSDEFDREFLIKTKNEAFARNILTFMLQQKLLDMKQKKPRITLEGTWLSVKVPRVVKTEEEYDQLFDLAFTFIDRLQEC